MTRKLAVGLRLLAGDLVFIGVGVVAAYVSFCIWQGIRWFRAEGEK